MFGCVYIKICSCCFAGCCVVNRLDELGCQADSSLNSLVYFFVYLLLQFLLEKCIHVAKTSAQAAC